jgi:sporulation protein YlmC with PRC-barrel domain
MMHNKAIEEKESTRDNKPGFISRVLSRLVIPHDRGEKYTDFTVSINSSRFLEKQQAIIKKGAKARATVLRVELTGQEISGKPVVLLSLCIDEYTCVVIQITSEAIIPVDRIPKVGDRIVIAFDPDDTGIIVVV